MKQRRIVLASASPRRKELLNQIGIYPEIIPSDLEEKVTSLSPSQVVEELSCQKAVHVWENYKSRDEEETVVIGSDTVVAVRGCIMGKPENEEKAVEMIGKLQGGCHQVYTGVTLISRVRTVTFSVKTDVWVYPMTEQEICRYVSGGESLDKAGAYGIQGSFAAFIERIEGSYTNVMGLPAGRVYQELKSLLEE